MKRHSVIYILFLLIAFGTNAQVSHGGRPLPLHATRSMDSDLFVEMPPFDVTEELRIDSLNESDLRGGYRFAYKFITDYTPQNSGTTFTLADGTRVWRMGIRSRDALSINILLTEYELPEGAQLFLYNADQSQVLGAFNQLNNSDLRLLPVAPVSGDELIIEYQEPAHAAFHGRLKIGEVNHAYRNLRGDEPRADKTSYACIPPLVCYDDQALQTEILGRSVVMLMIDGSIACTGALINNTENDGKPYLLTASHCLNRQFTVQNPDYAKVAGSIVCFFNYDSPLCKTTLRGTEEMSVASALYHAVNEDKDMALLELKEKPPVYYRPYYAGWNAKDAGKAPYTAIHHPGGSVKRINIFDGALQLQTFSPFYFEANSHWHISRWKIGLTAGGSSGSPLFDANHHIVGALSGGNPNMSCDDPTDDNYFAFFKAWNPSKKPEKQLKQWLDPQNKGVLTCEGLDPYAPDDCLRLSNVTSSGKKETVETTLNSMATTELAEEYNITGTAKVYGAYFVAPRIDGNSKDIKTEVTLYSGTDKPTTLLHTEIFQPTYTNKVGDSFQESAKPLDRAQETYIQFEKPIEVTDRFFIGYRITTTNNTPAFSVFNLPQGETTRNTAWINDQNTWTEASGHPEMPFSTSLFIDPVIQYQSPTANEEIGTDSPIRIFYSTEGRTIYVELPDETKSAGFKLISISGQTLLQQTIKENQTAIQVPSLISGVCILQVTYKNKRYVQKVLL